MSKVDSLFLEFLGLIDLGELGQKLLHNGMLDFVGHQALYYGNPRLNIKRQDCHSEAGIDAKHKLIQSLKKILNIKEVTMYIHLITYIGTEELPECVATL